LAETKTNRYTLMVFGSYRSGPITRLPMSHALPASFSTVSGHFGTVAKVSVAFLK